MNCQSPRGHASGLRSHKRLVAGSFIAPVFLRSSPRSYDMNLWNTLLPLRQALSSVSHNHALSYLGKENIELIDSFAGDAAATETVQRRIEEPQKLMKSLRVGSPVTW